jgi:chromosome segregation protein
MVESVAGQIRPDRETRAKGGWNVHLKRLEMMGFKSFADKTELEFVPGITAVVGPNGSGKSNVTDGIRWVLGEQSAKSLRGSKMEDVIFAGSDTRKPVGFCEVSITFDNTDRKLNLDYSEVTVTRRVYRSGESEYLLNRQPCRLKDITELFMDTGIGKEAYSMIGQGRIDDILSTKSEDRRAIFEEAAGIVKYKSRKKEAEKKLDATEQNLARLNDLVLELKDQVAPLAEQAEKAAQYKEWRAQLEQTEIGLYVHKIETLHQAWQEATKQVESFSTGQVDLAAEVSQREAKLESLRWEISRHEEEMEALQTRLLQVSEELEKVEGRRKVLLERIRNQEAAYTQTVARIGELQSTMARLREEQSVNDERLREKETELAEAEARLREAEARLAATGDDRALELERLRDRYRELTNEITALQSEERHLMDRRVQTERRLEELAEQEKQLAATERSLAERMEQLRRETAEVEQMLETVADQYRRTLEEKKAGEAELAEMAKRLRQAEQQVDALRSRHEIVKEMEAEHAGFFQGVKELLKARDRGHAALKGIHGAVAQLIQVPAEFEAAMETALGGALQHLVVDTEEDGRKGIRFLKENGLGRATFLPMDVIQPRRFPAHEADRLRSVDGFVGIAADLVKTDERYRSVVENLLGQVVVTRTLEKANAIARQLGYRYRVVTLDGDVVNPGGSMTGGSRQKSKVNLLGRTRQLEELETRLREAEREWRDIRDRVNALTDRQEAWEQSLEQLRRQGEEHRAHKQELHASEREKAVEHRSVAERLRVVSEERDKTDAELVEIGRKQTELAERLAALRQEAEKCQTTVAGLEAEVRREATEKDEVGRMITEWKVTVARLTQEKEHLKTNGARVREELERLDEQLRSAMEQQEELDAELERNRGEAEQLEASTGDLRTVKSETQARLDEARKKRDEWYRQREELERELREVQQTLRKQEDQLRQHEIKVNRMDVELNHLLEKLAEEYEMSFELARERFSVPEDPSQAEREVRSLKQKIASLGEVNLGAIEEYKRLTERLEFLEQQQNDLIEAKNTLYEVIRNIESEMSRRFLESFEAIRTEFQDVFVKMFGGGRADLHLTDPDNLLETGIEIMAQPPGKKLQNLGLLSGGERALTAIALLFAVIRVKPVPFCVLDEVDAALDDANVARFARYLREFSQNTQFIVITHRKLTMEGADVLYGITMEESGVSKLVSVKLEDFEEQVEVAAARS